MRPFCSSLQSAVRGRRSTPSRIRQPAQTRRTAAMPARWALCALSLLVGPAAGQSTYLIAAGALAVSFGAQRSELMHGRPHSGPR